MFFDFNLVVIIRKDVYDAFLGDKVFIEEDPFLYGRIVAVICFLLLFLFPICWFLIKEHDFILFLSKSKSKLNHEKKNLKWGDAHFSLFIKLMCYLFIQIYSLKKRVYFGLTKLIPKWSQHNTCKGNTLKLKEYA